MAKPSITNIRAPSSTAVWTPPKTVWDLNTTGDTSDPSMFAFSSESGESSDSGSAFNSLSSQIGYLNLGLTADEISHYDYVFLGVNGGENETVTGRYHDGGIIATGNGMDSIIGGDADDLIFAGNGKDTVAGGGGDDIIFGENGTDLLHGNDGADQISGGNGDDTILGDAGNDNLYGDAGNDTIAGGTDTGTFSLGSGGTVTLTGGAHLYTGAFGEVPGDNNDGGLNNQNVYVDHNSHMNQEGYTIDSGTQHIFQVFSYSPEDLPVLGVDDGHDFTAVLFDNENGGHTHVLDVVHFHLNLESDQYIFEFDLTAHPNGGKVFVYTGNSPTDAQLDDPIHTADSSSQPFHTLASVASVTSGSGFDFTAGDTITGGAGDDTIVWTHGDGVDLVMDFDQGNTGSFDPVNEHDALTLHLDTGWNVHTTTDPDTGDVVIYFTDASNAVQANSAIELTGITDASHLSIVNTIANDWQVTGV